MSIICVRNGIRFAYTGCVVSSLTFSIDNGTLMFNVSILGRDEATQTLPTPTWPTTQIPFGAGTYTIEVPVGSTVLDTDTFEFKVEDNAEAQYRLKATGTGAQAVTYGERTVTLTMERDFEARTEFDAFKALTAQAIRITASKGTNNKILLDLVAAVKDTYDVALSGQGDLLRASVSMQGVLDAAGVAYKVTTNTQLDLS
jgi:hypothetical protein